MTITLSPTESQDLYDFVLNHRNTGLPEIKKVKEVILSLQQLKDIYNIVANNRAKTRGTELYLDVNDNGEVTNIEYDEINMRPEDIVTPRPKDKREKKQTVE
jgi:hypothetical protein